jgi:hypothetical protein
MIRTFAWIAGAVAIAACAPVAPAKSVVLSGGDVVATTPPGYCVDAQTSQPANGFAVLAPCATLGSADVPPAVVGVATVQVGPPDSGTVTGAEIALRDFLITDAGNALLSTAGDGEDITVLSTQAFDSRVMVHFTDEGAAPIAGLQSEEWRAFTDVNGRLVTIAVRGLAVAPLQDGPGAALLKLILAGLKAATNTIAQEPAATPET